VGLAGFAELAIVVVELAGALAAPDEAFQPWRDGVVRVVGGGPRDLGGGVEQGRVPAQELPVDVEEPGQRFRRRASVQFRRVEEFAVFGGCSCRVRVCQAGGRLVSGRPMTVGA